MMQGVSRAWELPDHLIDEIFLRLPAETLLSFRALSKEWNLMIRSPSFARMQYHYYLINNNAAAVEHLIMWSMSKHGAHYKISTSSLYAHDFRLPRPTRIPLTIRCSTWDVLSSCHGMLLMKVQQGDDRLCISYLVWNPITLTCMKVHWPEGVDPAGAHFGPYVGLGYDQATDDYKIVIRTYGRTYVMGLKSNVWRIVEEEERCYWRSMSGKDAVTVDGDIYWLESNSSLDQVQDVKRPVELIKFSVTDEKLTILASLPYKEHEYGSEWHWILSRYKMSLCLFNYRVWPMPIFQPAERHWVHIWTLAQDKETWTELMDVPCVPLLQKYWAVSPFGFTARGDLIIGNPNNSLLIYLTSENRYVEVEDSRFLLQKYILYPLHGESLISPLNR